MGKIAFTTLLFVVVLAQGPGCARFDGCEDTSTCARAGARDAASDQLGPDASRDAGVDRASTTPEDAARADARSAVAGGDGGRDADSDASCPVGFADCNADPRDGCETALMDDENHCGACDHPCSVDGTIARACIAGACTPTCADGRADCVAPSPNQADDGCETNTEEDPDHCGACGHACAGAGTTARACNAGMCAPTCGAGLGDCTHPAASEPDDGCETDLTTSAANCGACGFACSNASASDVHCEASACKATCTAGFADCTRPAPTVNGSDDGCETDLDSATSCGACGKSCEGGACTDQLCGPVVLAQTATPSLYPASFASSSLALDATHVYFVHCIRSGSVKRVPKTGGAVEVLAADQELPAGVAVDSDSVYWTLQPGSSAAVRHRLLDDTTITDFWAPSDSRIRMPASIALTDTAVVWGDRADGALLSASKAAPGVSLIERPGVEAEVLALAAAGNVVVFSDGTAVRYATTDTTGVAVLETVSADDVVADGSWFYWDTGSAIHRMKVGASHPTALIDEDALRLTVTNSDVYYVTPDRTVKSVRIAGDDAEHVGVGRARATANDVFAMASDGTRVYWAENTTTQMRILKMVK
jgi:hypothetical protein